jgi:DNA-binding CsgD family transcriptional regulator/tetratricopeptide (TPR) repeat protein
MGRGKVVTIEGEAGIGKTSLALSFVETHRHDARIYAGGCEHLATPEPLGPLRDIARDSQGRFSVAATSQLTTYESLQRLLTTGREPGLLLIEDIHWADDPTLDLFRYLGRRIRHAPVLVVTTFRNDEAQARLAALWADMPRDCRERIELQPLSPSAVSLLADRSGRTSRDVYAVTGGNPFHVTEFLATESSAVPHSVRDATLARTSRLSSRARRTLDCASIFPRQIDQEMLQVISEDTDHSGVEECMQVGMLNSVGDSLAFRHELARRAVQDAISPLRRRELHGAALKLLKSRTNARASEIAHHAQQAGAAADMATYSLRAADEADALGAYRESVAHLVRVLEHSPDLSNAARADLLERQAQTGEQCGEFEIATAAIREAIDARKRAGDIVGLGNALRISARLYWQLGQTEVAEQLSLESLEVMRDHQDSWQYAMALSGQSQLDMLADRNNLAIPRADEAMARAERLGRADIYIHALTNGTTARSSDDPDQGFQRVLEAIGEATRRGVPDHLPRLYCSLLYLKVVDRQYDRFFEHCENGLAVADARDNRPLEGYLHGLRAQALIDLGRLPEALAEAELVVYGPYPRGTARFTPCLALAKVRMRMGLAEEGTLDELRAMPTARRDIMRRAPIAVIDAEALWLGLPRPGALDQLIEAFEIACQTQGQRWNVSETALWLAILGQQARIPEAVVRTLREPFRSHVTGAWREAAQGWSDLSCPWEQAIALSMGDEPAQREALVILDRIGATAAAARVRRQMRSLGTRAVPRGPIAETRANPAGLTRRQAQVLALIIEGLTNAQIAARLSLSPKTAEHHVAAVLARLGARTRVEAADTARQRGLLG